MLPRRYQCVTSPQGREVYYRCKKSEAMDICSIVSTRRHHLVPAADSFPHATWHSMGALKKHIRSTHPPAPDCIDRAVGAGPVDAYPTFNNRAYRSRELIAVHESPISPPLTASASKILPNLMMTTLTSSQGRSQLANIYKAGIRDEISSQSSAFHTEDAILLSLLASFIEHFLTAGRSENFHVLRRILWYPEKARQI